MLSVSTLHCSVYSTLSTDFRHSHSRRWSLRKGMASLLCVCVCVCAVVQRLMSGIIVYGFSVLFTYTRTLSQAWSWPMYLVWLHIYLRDLPFLPSTTRSILRLPHPPWIHMVSYQLSPSVLLCQVM